MARFDRLDDEASRWLRYRAVARAEKNRAPSPLDGIANALRRLRTSLAAAYMRDAIAGETRELPEGAETRMTLAIERAYRFVIRVAKELEEIERADLDAMDEWARIEGFAPFAIAFFDRVLEGPLRRAGADAAFMKKDVGEILDVLRCAMTSSAMAA